MDCSVQSLTANSAGIECCIRGRRQINAVKVWLLATIAGVSTDPTFLRDQAKCLGNCVSATTLLGFDVYLLTLIAGGTQDAQTLANNASCFRQPCIHGSLRAAMQIWILTQIAGTTSDPTTLLNNSKCIMDCIPAGELFAVETWLLSKIAGASSDSATLAAASKCFNCLNPDELDAISTLLLCNKASGAAAALSVSFFLDMEASVNATPVDAVIALAATHRASNDGFWTVIGGPLVQTTVTTLQERKLHGPVTVAGVTYDDNGSTRSWRVHNTAVNNYVRYELNTPVSKCSAGMAFFFSNEGVGWGTDFNSYDIWNLVGTGGEFLTVNLQNQPAGGGDFFIRVHTTAGVSAVQNNLKMNQWYWITMLWDAANAIAKMTIYNLDTLVPFAEMTIALINDTFRYTGISRSDNHGSSNADCYHYCDDMILDYTNAVYPLLP